MSKPQAILDKLNERERSRLASCEYSSWTPRTDTLLRYYDLIYDERSDWDDRVTVRRTPLGNEVRALMGKQLNGFKADIQERTE